MGKAIIMDYNISESDMRKQFVLQNDQVRFDFSDCYYIIEQDKHKPSGLRINKVGKKKSDQISIEAACSNVLSLF